MPSIAISITVSMGSTPTPRITRTNRGFELRAGNDLLCHVAWSDVARITADKVDRLTWDMVCLEIQSSAGVVCTVDEETEGFWDLVGDLKRALPTSEQDWEHAVIPPAFAENRRVIYLRC